MSQQMVDLWNTTAQAFDQRWEQIGDQWEAPTPCDEFDVRALVDHTVGVQGGMVAGMVGAQVEEGAEWPAVMAAISETMTAESLEGIVEGTPMGDVPRARMIGIAIGDLALHTWDLSRAIGVDDTLPAEVVPAVHGGLQMLPEEMMRASGRFAPAVEVGPDASAQDQLIAFSGRQP